jgi:DNA (cytosine-5)-methyltransferase 1
MRYATVCSGIEAATVAWAPLGWEAAWFSEIEPFPCSVLAHHYPDVPNLGDMTRIQDHEVFRGAAIDLLAGGTPCQSFSAAGLRKGLDDPRGNLALHFLALADAARPRWVVWENVPGVLSSSGGRDFGAFLGALGQLGYGWAYRVLDAQYFGVAQRRRRVFVVGHLGSWQRAAAVLFERYSLSGDLAPRRGAGSSVAGTVTRSFGERGQPAPDDSGMLIPDVAGTLLATNGRQGFRTSADDAANGLLVANTLRAQSQLAHREDVDTLIPALAGCQTAREGRGPDSDATTTLIAYGFRHRASAHDNAPVLENAIPSLRAADDDGQSVFVDLQNNRLGAEDLAGTLMASTPAKGMGAATLGRAGVRRLTPRECERLQGFPDDYTLVPHRGKPAADAPRYKGIGNSWPTVVPRWIGERIAAVDAIP